MKKLFFFLFFVFPLNTFAQVPGITPIPLLVGTCPSDDGSANAPIATVQHPTLLNGYAKTIRNLGCKAAGVDYAVGYPSATSLKDASSATLPTGCTRAAGQLIRCDGTANVVFDGWDFSVGNGYHLAFLNTSPNGTVKNSNFGGTNYPPISFIINADASSPGLTVKYNVIDGGVATPGSGAAQAALVNATGVGGKVVLQYNWFKNYGQQVADLNYASTTLDYRWNLIDNGNIQSGAHQNFMQWAPQSGSTTALVLFNTTYQNTLGGAEGFQFDADAAGAATITLTNPLFAYNTMIAILSSGSQTMSYLVHGSGDSRTNIVTLAGTPSVHDNYFDITGAFGAFYPSGGAAGPVWAGWSFSSNWNMTTGTALPNNP